MKTMTRSVSEQSLDRKTADSLVLEKLLCELVPRAQRGEREAMTELITCTKDRLYRFCLYLTHNQQQAQDLSQDCYVKALKNITSLKEPKAFASWLFRIAHNLFLNFVKSPRNAKYTQLEELQGTASSVDPAAGGRILDVQRALSKLKPHEKTVLLLVEFEGYAYKEAGEIMGLSESAVRSLLHRAREAFAEKFES